MNKIILFIPLFFLIYLFDSTIADAKRNRGELQPQKLYQLGSSDILPTGKLAKVFNLGSDYTDVQREDTLKAIKNNVVSWKLPVYEISRTGDDSYKIITQGGSNLVECIIYLTVFSDSEKSFVHSLKTGNLIPFKGLLTGETFMRSLVVRPAVLLLK